MANMMDEILKKSGLTYEQLSAAERDTLTQMTSVLDSNQLDVDAVRKFVRRLRYAVQQELDTMKKETPSNWISLVALFIPFYGLLRKWYQDEHKLYLEARLQNLSLIEAFLTGPKRAKEALNQAVASMVNNSN